MNRPILQDVQWFDLFVWAVRAVLIGALVFLVFGCAMNYATTSTNPACVIACTAPAPSSAASGIRIDQTITREGALDVGQP